MKTTFRSKKILTVCAIIALPAIAFAQQKTQQDPATSSTDNAAAGVAGSGTISNPASLFRTLDTDSNGQISRDEFDKINSVWNAKGTSSESSATGSGGATSTGKKEIQGGSAGQ